MFFFKSLHAIFFLQLDTNQQRYELRSKEVLPLFWHHHPPLSPSLSFSFYPSLFPSLSLVLTLSLFFFLSLSISLSLYSYLPLYLFHSIPLFHLSLPLSLFALSPSFSDNISLSLCSSFPQSLSLSPLLDLEFCFCRPVVSIVETALLLVLLFQKQKQESIL